MKHYIISLPVELKERAAIYAKTLGISVAALIRMLLTKELKKHDKGD